MTSEQGTDFEESKAFWGAVGKPAKYDSLHVGDFLMLEDHRFGSMRRRPIIITNILPNPNHGRPDLTFREATDDEIGANATNYLVLIAGERE